MIDTTLPNLYDRLTELDFNGKAAIFLQSKGFSQRADGKWARGYSATWDTPWIHQHKHLGPDRDCEMWHQLFFEQTKWTPTFCKSCWKVVVNIPTVEMLFAMYELQKILYHPCKCGLEHRPTDERRYGAYFYNESKEQGLETLEKVRLAVTDRMGSELGADPTKIFLKCACSEYEIQNGPPAEYEPTKEQLALEDGYKKYVVTNNISFEQRIHQEAAVMLRWIHHAAHIGDLTYQFATGGKSMMPSMKTYEKE